MGGQDALSKQLEEHLQLRSEASTAHHAALAAVEAWEEAQEEEAEVEGGAPPPAERPAKTSLSKTSTSENWQVSRTVPEYPMPMSRSRPIQPPSTLWPANPNHQNAASILTLQDAHGWHSRPRPKSLATLWRQALPQNKPENKIVQREAEALTEANARLPIPSRPHFHATLTLTLTLTPSPSHSHSPSPSDTPTHPGHPHPLVTPAYRVFCD